MECQIPFRLAGAEFRRHIYCTSNRREREEEDDLSGRGRLMAERARKHKAYFHTFLAVAGLLHSIRMTERQKRGLMAPGEAPVPRHTRAALDLVSNKKKRKIKEPPERRGNEIVPLSCY